MVNSIVGGYPVDALVYFLFIRKTRVFLKIVLFLQLDAEPYRNFPRFNLMEDNPYSH